MAFDNTFWNGKVALPEIYKDDRTKAIRAFNEKVRSDKRVDMCYTAFADGITFVRKL